MLNINNASILQKVWNKLQKENMAVESLLIKCVVLSETSVK